MTKNEFLEEVVKPVFEQIKGLFEDKNKNYGTDADIYYNFRQMAQRNYMTDDLEAQYSILEILLDKHNTSLIKNGLSDTEFLQRQCDRILYSLLAIGMYLLHKNQD